MDGLERTSSENCCAENCKERNRWQGFEAGLVVIETKGQIHVEMIGVIQARACENAMGFLYVGDHMKEKYMSWRIAMTRKESDAYIKQKAPMRDDLMYRPGEKKRRGRYAPLRSYAKQTREAPSAVVTGSL